MKHVVLVALAACGGAPGHRAAVVTANDDITLYRDLALVRQRVELTATAEGATHVAIKASAGLTGEQVVVFDRGGTVVTAVHVKGPPPKRAAGSDAPPVDPACGDEGCATPDDPETEEPPVPKPADGEPAPIAPTTIVLDVYAPKAGRFAITIGYLTEHLHWDAAYTMTTTPERLEAVLHGAIAVRNTTGIVFPPATLHVIDAELGGWRSRTAEHLATSFVGGTPSSTPAAAPRDVGIAAIGSGETRIELAGISAPRSMRSVLVYDPIGTKLDNAIPGPVRDAQLGVTPVAATRITESFEIRRDEHGAVGLPAGPVRLLERRLDGTLHVLGESRLFDAATRVADVDTIAVGTADDVTGHRTRRELTIDDERKRITEEFEITLDNAREHAVGVLIREHLYRGQNWVLAYESTKHPDKEGAQQITMRTDVPAKAHAKVLYVVVYTWGQ